VLPEELVETIAEACHRAGQEDFRLVSGAAHDAMNFVDVCPVGMVFVRSRDGVSHSPEEYTSPEDAAVGAEIMFHTVCILADACE
jgi:allantoate deiminase